MTKPFRVWKRQRLCLALPALRAPSHMLSLAPVAPVDCVLCVVDVIAVVDCLRFSALFVSRSFRPPYHRASLIQRPQPLFPDAAVPTIDTSTGSQLPTCFLLRVSFQQHTTASLSVLTTRQNRGTLSVNHHSHGRRRVKSHAFRQELYT
jgi:hypothetical protein